MSIPFVKKTKVFALFGMKNASRKHKIITTTPTTKVKSKLDHETEKSQTEDIKREKEFESPFIQELGVN